MKFFGLALLVISAFATEPAENSGTATCGDPLGEKDARRFAVIMCNSHMCNECALDWCRTTCQQVQLEFNTCRCDDWPEARTSFSGGEFAGKGTFGDVGDYGR